MAKSVLSVTESVILTARMTKRLAAEIVCLYEMGRDIGCVFGARTARKIVKISAGLDIRQLDVIHASKPPVDQRRGSKRKIVVRLIFGKSTESVEDYVVIGTCIIDYDFGMCWDPDKREACERLCWGVEEGEASVEFPNGHIETGPTVIWSDGTADLPPL